MSCWFEVRPQYLCCVTLSLTLQSARSSALSFWFQVRLKQDEAAMAYGRAELSKAAISSADQEDLQDALSLLAYDMPETSPCGSLLGQSHRTHLASSLTAAISLRQGQKARPALHQLFCHAVSFAMQTPSTIQLTSLRCYSSKPACRIMQIKRPVAFIWAHWCTSSTPGDTLVASITCLWCKPGYDSLLHLQWKSQVLSPRHM